MRSFTPTDKYDAEEAARLGAEPWQLAMLARNPDYTCWGPHEDYMWVKGDGWNSPIKVASWSEFKWNLDTLNECVNFYFFIGRASASCAVCAGSGYHPDAQWVTESFYEHSSPFVRGDRPLMAAFAERFGGAPHQELHGPCSFPSAEVLARYAPGFREFCEAMRAGDGYWVNKITQDEADALVVAGRLRTFRDGKHETVPRTASEVNAANGRGALLLREMDHDGINRSILCRTRCERFGIPTTCPTCDGHGSVFTESESHLGIVFWWIHPRKGASRGVEVLSIERKQVPEVLKFLRTAAKRNAKRFAGIQPRARAPKGAAK